ncbi:hypothetical protein BJ508DRAFT_333488 [Ascobolus immersus RN42]|uniref:Uncharacterized protein n=1 Tax=Ascobolus immersus RN42 TaxID=1160509 RepID=A0A3N4HJB5_ASCIM|nr:hypothetical protein BJ508DRAFT_333488 [Ascobolus immersus RN42]
MDPKVIGSLVKPPPQLRGKEDYPRWADTIYTNMTLIDRLDLLEGREEAPTPLSPLQQGGRGRERGNSQEVQNDAQAQRAYEEEAMRYRKKKALKEQYSARTVEDIVSLYRRLTNIKFRDAEHPAETVAEYNSFLSQADERLKASMGAIDAKVLSAIIYLEGMELHFPQQVAMLLRDNQHAVPVPQGLKSLDFHNIIQEIELLMSICAPESESSGKASKAFRATSKPQERSSSAEEIW